MADAGPEPAHPDARTTDAPAWPGRHGCGAQPPRTADLAHGRVADPVSRLRPAGRSAAVRGGSRSGRSWPGSGAVGRRYDRDAGRPRRGFPAIRAQSPDRGVGRQPRDRGRRRDRDGSWARPVPANGRGHRVRGRTRVRRVGSATAERAACGSHGDDPAGHAGDRAAPGRARGARRYRPRAAAGGSVVGPVVRLRLVGARDRRDASARSGLAGMDRGSATRSHAVSHRARRRRCAVRGCAARDAAGRRDAVRPGQRRVAGRKPARRARGPGDHDSGPLRDPGCAAVGSRCRGCRHGRGLAGRLDRLGGQDQRGPAVGGRAMAGRSGRGRTRAARDRARHLDRTVADPASACNRHGGRRCRARARRSSRRRSGRLAAGRLDRGRVRHRPGRRARAVGRTRHGRGHRHRAGRARGPRLPGPPAGTPGAVARAHPLPRRSHRRVVRRAGRPCGVGDPGQPAERAACRRERGPPDRSRGQRGGPRRHSGPGANDRVAPAGRPLATDRAGRHRSGHSWRCLGGGLRAEQRQRGAAGPGAWCPGPAHRGHRATGAGCDPGRRHGPAGRRAEGAAPRIGAPGRRVPGRGAARDRAGLGRRRQRLWASRGAHDPDAPRNRRPGSAHRPRR